MINQSKRAKLTGPIPGENYTSDTRNYPWHRPPEISDYVEVVDKAITNLDNPQRTALMMALMETGESIVDIVTGMTRIAVSQGKIPIDMAILAAGPIARMLEVIAEKAEIDYTRGWDQKPRLVTAELLKAMGGKVDPDDLEEVAENLEGVDPEAAGLMSAIGGPADPEIQDEMLGAPAADEEEIQE